jgi:2,5-diketo-D-gluconate reductase A
MDGVVQLSNGSMPIIGLGTYLMNDAEVKGAVTEALKLSYRRIDTAEFYANHKGIAEGIMESGLARSDLFITDKLSPSDMRTQTPKTYEDTIAACKKYLGNLQTDYLDLYLLHHAFPKSERINQWRALVFLQKEGLVRNIGVSNWSEKHIEEIKKANLPLPALNQIELHPLCTQQKLVSYCHNNNIVVEAYSSLAPAATWRVDPGQNSSKTSGDVTPDSPITSIIQSIQAKHNGTVSEAQILLKWALQHNYTIIPKSSKRERLAENINLFHFELSSDDMAALDAFDENKPLAWPIGNPLDCP